jgi:sucrose-6-phosphate hydrolase SacC (GH32 family)
MMLFPTEFKLVTTGDGLRMRATPIAEIERLRGKARTWSSVTAAEANQALDKAGTGPLDVRVTVTLEKESELVLRYQGTTLATIHAADLEKGRGSVEVLIDKAVAEIFVDGGARYIVREIPTTTVGHGLEFDLGKSAGAIERLEISPVKSIW